MYIGSPTAYNSDANAHLQTEATLAIQIAEQCDFPGLDDYLLYKAGKLPLENFRKGKLVICGWCLEQMHAITAMLSQVAPHEVDKSRIESRTLDSSINYQKEMVIRCTTRSSAPGYTTEWGRSYLATTTGHDCDIFRQSHTEVGQKPATRARLPRRIQPHKADTWIG
ncbi:hypothetical protein NLG97_g9705 [Lecanicillium saksenae]|uniref:Uncharacterized protein n=1 Tax=Lecanicillium saksenae TaxID=468837 RepID=A0ACC1QII5_9HYPO|nr:hypothetical protein NLG97_g9705 [Lecanicillium saksenae]